MFKNKKILITGGTGSFGHALVNRLLRSNLSEIRIFSRDEKKQDDMRRLFKSDNLKFYLGDVRDSSSLSFPICDVDFIFHAAALKQVPSCEFYPVEAIKTNAMGTSNILDKSIEYGVKKVICLSTDKAVNPINAMGMSKALMEKIAISKSRIKSSTDIMITRYGNVIGSRGSVIPLFYEKIINNESIPITDPEMTRFLMTMNEAIDLVLYAFKNGRSGDIYVKKSPAASIKTISEAMIKLYGNKTSKAHIIGVRHGEKKHETLLSIEERITATEKNNYFRVSPDNRSLNYQSYYEKGNKLNKTLIDYSSNNTKIMNIEETIKLFKSTLDY